MACCDAAQTLNAIRARCIELAPQGIAGRLDPKVWRCLVCLSRGEYPGFKHFPGCPVAALHVPIRTPKVAHPRTAARAGQDAEAR